MNADKGVERRLERYVLDELSTGERKRLEELLTGNDAEAAAARDALRFEQCLLKSCEVSSFDGDLAATVLERVFRRNAVRSRGPADEGQARRLIEEAMREGRVRSGVPRERQVPWIRVAAAAAFIGFTALCWWTVGREIRREPHPNAPGQGRTEVAKTTPKAPDLTAPHPLDLVTRPDLRPVAHVAYAPPGQELSEEDSMLPLTLVASAGGGSALFAGSEIETDESESAVLRLEQGGLLVLRPATRLRLIGTGQGSVQIQLEQGAVVFQLPPKGRPLDLMTLDGRRSRLHGGSGEVSLGSSMTDRAAAGMLPLRQILMVRPRRAGFATLVSGTEAVRVTSGQVGLASSETALAFDDQVGPVSGMVRREWRIDELVPQASALALSVGNREFTRAEIAKDLLRVYGEDLVELVTRSVVVQWELQRLGIPITPADRQDAEAHVANDEMMQVAPLRSTVARDERVSIMAGLLALCRHRSQAANGDVALTVAQQANQTWAAIERQLELDPALDDPRVAFRIRYQGMTVQVTVRDTTPPALGGRQRVGANDA